MDGTLVPQPIRHEGKENDAESARDPDDEPPRLMAVTGSARSNMI